MAKIKHIRMHFAALAIAVSSTLLTLLNGFRPESAQECLSTATTDGKVDYTYFNGCSIRRCERKCNFQEPCTKTCRFPKGVPKEANSRTCNLRCYDAENSDFNERCYEECLIYDLLPETADQEKLLINAALQ
jgi:hypothetical protein